MNEAQIIKTLDLAQCELRAMYKKLGYQDSNVLREIDAVHEALTKQKKLNKPDVMESLRPTDDEIGAKVEEYGFRVPYDGSNNFYDDEAIKHFRAGAKWARSFGRNAP